MTGTFDPAVPSSARIYDYWLGGKDNYAVDREAAGQAIAANPGIVADVRANRAFLARVVTFLAAECGDPAVPGHRHRAAHGEQHPSGRPGGRPVVPDRVRG